MERKVIALISMALAGSVAAVGLIALFPPRDSPTSPYKVSMSVNGPLVVGSDLQIIIIVQGDLSTSTFPTGMFLSLDVGGLAVTTPDQRDDSWGIPSVWNVTGMTLANGRQFRLNAIPVYAQEMTLLAMIWSPKPSFFVRIDPDGHLPDPGAVVVLGLGALRISILQQLSEAAPANPLQKALADALLAVWFFLPAYVANPMAALLGGGTPIDFGRSLRDGRRVFGDGKTWRGLSGGVVTGIALGLFLHLAGSVASAELSFGPTPAAAAFAIVLLPAGALLGDLAGAFAKRRLGKPRGAPVPGLDQYDFVLGAIALLLLFDRDWWLPRYWAGDAIYGLLLIIVITPLLHRAVNILGYRMGAKREPW